MLLTIAEAIGYALMTAKSMGLTKNQMERFDEMMRIKIENIPQSDALEYYYYYHDDLYFE